jgi:hypothetical protein
VGQVDLDHQQNDYNPGSFDDKPFWTVPFSPDDAHIDLGTESAYLTAKNMALPDFHDVRSALTGGPSVPATVSFNLQWSGVVRRLRVTNETDGFTGFYIEDRVNAECSAQQEGFRFVSDPASTTENVYSVIGRERNGVFFRRHGALEHLDDLEHEE